MGSSDKSKDAIEEDLAAMLSAARLQAQRAGSTGPMIRPLPASQLEAPLDIPSDTDGPEIQPPEIAGFNILREIGSGGQATVFEATQNSTGQRVAIKVMPGGRLVGARRRERFDREARVLSALTHPNVVGIIDRGSASDGSLYLVMDYIDGRPLDEYAIAVRSDALPKVTIRLLQIFIKICQAVADAHAKGIIHRDLKPSNIRVDRGGEPHVLDFGLARVLGPEPTSGSVTLTGQILGSLPWASPEQVSGGANDLDARSDVYSLGVMLYQLLTGHFPYSVSGPIPTVAQNILRSQPKPPSQFTDISDNALDRGLDAIVLKSLAKIPDARYETAGELGRALEQWLTELPKTELRSATLRSGLSRRVISVMVCVALLVAATTNWRLYRLPSAPSSGQKTLINQGTSGWPHLEHISSSMMNSLGTPLQAVAVNAVMDDTSSGTAPPATHPIHINSLGMRLAYIPDGHFVMGSPLTELPRNPDENQHTVLITKSFYMGVTTVTRDQYRSVIGIIPGDAAGGDVPVTFVSWDDAHQFCEKLSQIDHQHYRLPTEAEWEYACRAGTTTMIGGTGKLDDMGWYSNYSRSPMPVGRKLPNAWGLYDMHGNVSQWCEDRYQNRYPNDPDPDPLYRVKSSFVLTRGGDFTVDLKSCRSAARGPRRPDSQTRGIGFRVVMEILPPPVNSLEVDLK